MPGSVTMTEASGQPAINADADYSLAIIGYTSRSAVAAGVLSPLYQDPAAAVTDCGVGDALDALCQSISATQGNPGPAPSAIYSTPAASPGAYGAINVAGVTGTAVVTNRTAVAPLGTYQPYMKITTGGTVGVSGMVALASLDGGRTTRQVAIGTLDHYAFPSTDGWGDGSQAGFTFAPSSADLTALNTLINELYTDFNAHVILVGGSPVHGSTGAVDVVTIASATDTASRIARINALRVAYIAHIARTSGAPGIHITADVSAADQLAYGAATTDGEALLLALDLKAKYNLHRVNLTVHTNADSTNATTSAAPSMGVFVAGDVFYTSTTPPMFADADLYDPSDPTAVKGAFAVIAESSQQFGTLVITEPVAAGDFSTLAAGLNYGATFGKRWSLIVRFRDPASGETDAAYVLAFQAFASAHHDDRITCLAGSCWVTDAYTGRVYLRSFLAPYLARLASRNVVAGEKGERLAQNPGWVRRGPLEGASLKDDGGNLVGHDEAKRGGIEAANGAPVGGGVALYFQRNFQRAGTYITNRATTLYPVNSAILTPMDRAVANAVEQLAIGISLDFIGGADIVDPSTLTLDDDVRQGLAQAIQAEIAAQYPSEFANATDPNLVTVNPTVTRSGAQVTITGVIAVQFYDYTDRINLTFAATR